jgi:hypothetical protein
MIKFKFCVLRLWISVLFFVLTQGLPGLSEFYWEEPELFSVVAGHFPVSAFSGDFSVIAWQEPAAGPDARTVGDGFISISLGIKSTGSPWQIRRSVGGPYAYSGTEPSILSIALDKKGRILIAAAVSAAQTEILISGDRGQSFSRSRVDTGSESSVAPRIFARSDGGYILFVTRGSEQSLSIYYALSEDGAAWSPFEQFVKDPSLPLNFLPTHGSLGTADYVIFQSFVGGDADALPAFQLFLMTSADGGRSWTSPRRFTDFQDPVMNTAAPAGRFDNQRPHLSNFGSRLFLVWERRYGTGSPQIYGASIGPGGNILEKVERINTEEAYCNNPVAFLYENTPTVVWFDNRRGSDRVFLAQWSGIDWRNYDLSGSSGEASFARPVVDGDGLFVFWQGSSRGTGRIFSLRPDTTVNSPRLSAVNFTPSRRTRADRVQVSWTVPRDPSGIKGFSWSWGRSPGETPPGEVLVYNTGNANQTMELFALDDGPWYFSLSAQDFAENWSSPARLEYVRDTTPPAAPEILFPELDSAGYLVSNTFSLEWNPPPDPDVAGYAWNLSYLGAAESVAGLDEGGFTLAAESRFLSPAPRLPGLWEPVILSPMKIRITESSVLPFPPLMRWGTSVPLHGCSSGPISTSPGLLLPMWIHPRMNRACCRSGLWAAVFPTGETRPGFSSIRTAFPPMTGNSFSAGGNSRLYRTGKSGES